VRKASLTNLGSMLTTAAIGGGLMYVFDPDRGRTRRALLRQKAIRGIHIIRCQANKQLRNAGHHIIGRAEEIKSAFHDRSIDIPDDILLERVRAQLGRAVRHFGMLEVRVEDGCVIAKGPVLNGETKRIGKRLSKVRGIRDWDLRLNEINEAEMNRMSGSRAFSPERVAL
jgi:hypothetical protein